MIADINKYRKLDKELTSLRQKHDELDKNLNSKINEITLERDELQITCDQLKEKVQQYEQLKIKYDQLIQKRSKIPANKLQEELNELKIHNDQLRQRNWKIMDELNKLLHDQQQNQDISSS
jgi:DNA repair exonuclease SbcCD ATPase subunit